MVQRFKGSKVQRLWIHCEPHDVHRANLNHRFVSSNLRRLFCVMAGGKTPQNKMIGGNGLVFPGDGGNCEASFITLNPEPLNP